MPWRGPSAACCSFQRDQPALRSPLDLFSDCLTLTRLLLCLKKDVIQARTSPSLSLLSWSLVSVACTRPDVNLGGRQTSIPVKPARYFFKGAWSLEHKARERCKTHVFGSAATPLLITPPPHFILKSKTFLKLLCCARHGNTPN